MKQSPASVGVGSQTGEDLRGAVRGRTSCSAFFGSVRLLVITWFVMVDGVSLRAQGNLTPLQTGGADSVVSVQEILQLAGMPNPTLAFNFGFVSDEVFVPDTFLDSFTVTLQDSTLTYSVVLVTLDPSGALWLPPPQGTAAVADSQLQRWPVAPSSLSPVNGRGNAFAVQLALPAEFAGNSIQVTFDLFDNQNAIMSLGWYSDLRVFSVPEPQALVLLGLGLLILRCSKKN